ncbi:hypothetical protein OVA24_07365 [Luteolibacter sp. SL250]|uniref:hypothetical protein n=1 Tax=Luteolibacter sp. SL250 TaxID=2995170 RepID=UPI00226E0111|nr:hypothetical protein [Luteolibacter sp. SL250]WAC21200.1 hypothetical protein OVA24_07365 [Luteolibacter sp. SL250]
MKKQLSLGLASLLMAGYASAGSGLYYVGAEPENSLPLKWMIGLDAVYDNNVTPGAGAKEDAFSLNPYVGLSVVSITPQTSWDVYARLGLIYYLDAPSNVDDVYGQARIGANMTHRFNDRLRVSSRNFLSYELEPDYSYGFATSRQLSEYFYWQTDNSVGYRWSERFATYSGFVLSGLDYDDVPNSDRFSWSLYNQFRYQLSPQTVATLDYRYTQTDGDGLAEDSDDHYLLVGLEHRFSPNSIIIAKAGAQFRDVDGGDTSTNPFLEVATSTRVNEQFTVRGFARYSVESYDTTQVLGAAIYDFSERQTLRIGISAEYAISPMFTVFSGVDYIASDYDSGNLVSAPGPAPTASGLEDRVINAYIGLSVKFTDYLTGTATYNFTDFDSDFAQGDYNRNRFSVGVRAEF